MKNAMDIIKRRRSVRTYDGKPVKAEKIKALEDYIVANGKGPFGNSVRFLVVDVTESEKDELKSLGTYGIIKGPRMFLAGAVKKGPRAMEDFGYCMESAILKATELGLGTCWLGGFLNRSTFGVKMKVTDEYVIPAVTPLGYAAEKPWIGDRALRTLSGGNKRKPFGELFFEGSLETPLQPEAAGAYMQVLEAVRLAPSASNKQPWRIVRERGSNTFHLYLREDKVYNRAIKGIEIQRVDMGIALCHFERAAAGLGLQGSWMALDAHPEAAGLEYFATWRG